MRATIQERGNGFPDVGDCVPGDDGNLYRVTGLDHDIQTGRHPGAANWVRARVELADWTDLAEGDEAAQCLAIVDETGGDE